MSAKLSVKPLEGSHPGWEWLEVEYDCDPPGDHRGTSRIVTGADDIRAFVAEIVEYHHAIRGAARLPPCHCCDELAARYGGQEDGVSANEPRQ